ncbi:MAG: HAD-IA family hydrolase [Dechloromonas sp.]|uniref:HAD-IA family hydrolase n=1 Tax=Dechloromonas sp. CZR5 TaxID=2608630 RepID=UPI00123D1138|nr:HAD-IA family hydrolase [Dechloromonas sp. CZR5]MBS4016967.1 HAD-IA family hydrolase [Dechloromonas sp.]
MTRLEALLWDVDGTLAETERDGHRIAFNRAFEALGLQWRWSEAQYGELLCITGGRERLMHYMDSEPDAPPLAEDREALAHELHAKKNAIYAKLVNSAGIPLREGVRELMHECRERGVRMAIATTTSRTNVEALLRVHLGPRWSDWFTAIVCGEDVQRKKPDPEVFVQALRTLGIPPHQAVAIEDSPAGVAAARAAECPVVVTRSTYFANAPIKGATAVGPGLHSRSGWRPALAPMTGGRVTFDDLAGWFAQASALSDIP